MNPRYLDLFKNLYNDINKKARGTTAPLSILKAVQAAVLYSTPPTITNNTNSIQNKSSSSSSSSSPSSSLFQEGMKKERELYVELMKGFVCLNFFLN